MALILLVATLLLVWHPLREREAPAERAPPVRTAAHPPAAGKAPRSAPAAPAPRDTARPRAPDQPEEAAGDPSLATLRVLVVVGKDVPCAGAAFGLTDYARGKHRIQRRTGPDGRVEIRDLVPGRPQLSVLVGGLRRITTVVLTAGRVTETTVAIPRGSGVVEGIVRHRGAGPLSDAAISLIARNDDGSSYLHGESRAGGCYRIEAVPPATYAVEVSSPTAGGGARRGGEVVVTGGETVRCDIEIGSLGLHGVVRDAVTRRPLAGVLVRMQKPVSREYTTGEDGTYRLYDIRAGAGKLVLVKEGYELLFVELDPFDGGEPRARDILLHRAAVLDLHVTDEEGRPVRGALRLHLIDLDDPAAPSVSTGVVADAAGRAVYRKVRPGRYELSLRQGDARSRAQEFEVRAGTSTLHFRLSAQPEIPMLVGTVRDAATRKPVPGVKIHAMSLQKGATTDERGEFRYLRLTTEEQILHVSKDGYGAKVVRTQKLEKGRTRNIAIELGPGATLELTVRNPQGGPPTDRRIALLLGLPGAKWTMKLSAHLELDENGYVAYRCVPPGKYRLIVASREGSAKLDVDVPASGASVDVRLQ